VKRKKLRNKENNDKKMINKERKKERKLTKIVTNLTY
jgi:hypothetical protein